MYEITIFSISNETENKRGGGESTKKSLPRSTELAKLRNFNFSSPLRGYHVPFPLYCTASLHTTSRSQPRSRSHSVPCHSSLRGTDPPPCVLHTTTTQ